MHSIRRPIRLRIAVASMAAALGSLGPVAASRAPAPEIELRQPGHDPSARWTAAGALGMLFVRDEGGRGRLYYTDSRARAATPTAVSPAGVAVVAQPQTGPALEILPDGTMVAVYSVSVPGKHRTEIRAQRSMDRGGSWSAPVPVNDDQASGPHGWISTAVDASGGVQVAWLDKRGAEQGLVWTRTADGIHFETNRVIDSRVCFCCATALLASADGRSWIAYRDLEGKDLRNIAFVSRTPDGRFTAPAVVSDDGWRLDGCPDSGPRMALAPGGGVWAVWFNGAAPGIFSAFASDGRRFSPRLQIAAPAADGVVPNHPEIAVLPDRRVIAVYVARGTIFGRLLSRDGKNWSDPVSLVEQAAEPRLSVAHGRYALSFTAHRGNELLAVAGTRSLEGLTAVGH